MRMQRKLSCHVQAAPADVESFRDVVMDESTLRVHQVELVVNARPGAWASNLLAPLEFAYLPVSLRWKCSVFVRSIVLSLHHRDTRFVQKRAHFQYSTVNSMPQGESKRSEDCDEASDAEALN